MAKKASKRVGKALKKYVRSQKNVEKGFWNATGFHPLRKSRDYDPDRASDDYGSASDNKGFGKKKKNPVRSVKKKTILLKNPGSVRIQQLPNGKIGVTVVRNKKRR